MDKMISTKALYGDYLAHARTYSHKYIKREPDGKGGWVYTYPTDSNGSRLDRTETSYNMRSARSTISSPYGTTNATKYRQSAKAGQIYQEGLSQNEKDAAEKRAKIEAARRERQNNRNDKKTEDMMYQNEYENNTRSGWTDVTIDKNPYITYGPGNFEQTAHLSRRKENLSDTNQPVEVKRRGKGLGTGPVGSRPGSATGEQILTNSVVPSIGVKVSDVQNNSITKKYVDAAKTFLNNLFGVKW